MTIILDGKIIKAKILEELKTTVNSLIIKPSFVTIQVGDDEASNKYIEQKRKMAEYIGYNYQNLKLPASINTKDMLIQIDQLNKDSQIHGILIQLPLPKHLDSQTVLNNISPTKDIDGLTMVNQENLLKQKDSIIPCTPLGILELFDYYNIELKDKNIVIIGRSNIIGKPLYNLLVNKNANVTICHSKTQNIQKIISSADILIVAIGKANYIQSSMVKENAIIIDCGINFINNKLVGDVNFSALKNKCFAITPVPGGVGQTTVAALAKNVYKVYKKQIIGNNLRK